MNRIPSDVQRFMEEIIRQYISGSRSSEFVLWVVTEAVLILEIRGLYPPIA